MIGCCARSSCDRLPCQITCGCSEPALFLSSGVRALPCEGDLFGAVIARKEAVAGVDWSIEGARYDGPVSTRGNGLRSNQGQELQ